MLGWIVAGLLAVQPAIDNQAADTFSVEADGLRHQSGFLCPAALDEAKLIATRNGSPGDPTAGGSFCEYREGDQPVAYLAFSRKEGAPLTDGWCRRLPSMLHLQMGPRLPGVARYEGIDAWPEGAPVPQVQGENVNPVTCTLARPPFTPAIIVYSVAAFDHGDWTVRAVNTPIPPPCCAGYRGVRKISKDMLALILVLETTQKFARPST